MSEKIEKRFLEDVKNHQMTVIQDNGTYRHLRFSRPETNSYYFDIVTWPHRLIITGDCGTWVFSRIEDMLQFFRAKPEKADKLYINPSYWAEKILAHDRHGKDTEFSEEAFQQKVKEVFDSHVEWKFAEGKDKEKSDELWEAIENEVLIAENEYSAHEKLRDFEHEGFEFHDSWEYDLSDYTHHYLWNLYAIVWGIRKYDEAKTAALKASE